MKLILENKSYVYNEYDNKSPKTEPPHEKTNKMACAQQRRLRSAWATQSDQSLRCPHEEKLGSLATHLAHSKELRLIRLGGCPG